MMMDWISIGRRTMLRTEISDIEDHGDYLVIGLKRGCSFSHKSDTTEKLRIFKALGWS